MYLCIYLSIYVSIYLSIYLSIFYLSLLASFLPSFLLSFLACFYIPVLLAYPQLRHTEPMFIVLVSLQVWVQSDCASLDQTLS